MDQTGIEIISTVQAPLRTGGWGSQYQALEFLTSITFDTHEKGRQAIVETTQINFTLSARGDFDFMQVVYDSPKNEKVYGMGLQLTESNFKGKQVHMITSEGGVGRGLAPVTQMMNDEQNNQGGNTMTTYAPAYTFATSMRRGFVFNHTEIGNVNFAESRECFSVMMWHINTIKMNVLVGKSMKDVVTGITKIVGRMKPLPAWTQTGAIVGLQGGQDSVTKQYDFLKSQGVPMVSVWMQDWVGTY